MEAYRASPAAVLDIALTPHARAHSAVAMLWPFATAILLGAFLSFQIQPIIGRFILPWFGGGPGVWTVCLLFFQVLLLCGYGYAHWSIQRLAPRMQAGIHLALLALCAALLNVMPEASWKPLGSVAIANPTYRIVLLLAAHVGLPFFVLSATSPLLQAWVSRRNEERAPYRLFALSNVGSLVALISYPFLVEPLLGRAMQAGIWSWTMRIFIVVCGCCAILVWREAEPSNIKARPQGAATPPAPASAISLRRPVWMLWFLLPATASMLLMATTNKICQDIAVVPFLWVLPLALYLLSFVLTFDGARWYWRRFYMVALAAGFAGLLYLVHVGDVQYYTRGLVMVVGIYMGALFVACMILHGELVRLRPPAQHLTGFYLTIAAGGAAGGVFVAIIAPFIFSDYYELPIGMLLCCELLGVALLLDKSSFVYRGRMRFVWRGLALVLVGLTLLLQWFSMGSSSGSVMARCRSFYGVLSVSTYYGNKPSDFYVSLVYGGINHGYQYLDPVRKHLPIGYYGDGTGAWLAVKQLAGEGPRHIGVVGLGAGTMAVFGRTGDRIRFYEINPQVATIASEYFTYLKDSPAKVDVVMGDGRLSLEAESPQAFDVLLLDAFSSDAIPLHMLTREAFEVYLRHMNPRGVIVAHITNRYVNLEPVLARLAVSLNLHAVSVWHDQGSCPTRWVLLAHDPTVLDGLKTDQSIVRRITSQDAAGSELWTDDHASLFSVLY